MIEITLFIKALLYVLMIKISILLNYHVFSLRTLHFYYRFEIREIECNVIYNFALFCNFPFFCRAYNKCL